MSVVLSSVGGRADIQLMRNDAFARTCYYKLNGVLQNITGFTFAAQIRNEDKTLAASFTCTITNAAGGEFTIGLTSAQTASLTLGRPYVWDLQLTQSGQVSTLIRGYVTVYDEVTT